MLMTKRRKQLNNQSLNLSEWEYLLNQFNEEAERIKCELDNIQYQQDFFGDSTQLLREKNDLYIFHQWLLRQIREFSQLCSAVMN